MTVLCAYYRGDVLPENRASFDDYVRTVHLPLVAEWPRLRRLRLLSNDRKEYLGEMPQYYQCFELTYDSQADLEASLGSPHRDRTREISIRDRPRFRDLYEGEVLHMVYETESFEVARPGPAGILRCAHYLGTVDHDDRERFDRYVREVHLPDVASWPHMKGLRLQKNEGQDFLGQKPLYYHTFELTFANHAEMDACMASDARKETRRVAGIDRDSFKGLFKGEVHHANYSVTEFELNPT